MHWRSCNAGCADTDPATSSAATTSEERAANIAR
jgi:hypothetical protein